ncbi:MAG: ABC transporter substrate-binding protein [Treponema sp.]|jgi:iron complex transport system substrate-binding protein|nr:ABC transporter substrate-binding protein [Treponema sp.]
MRIIRIIRNKARVLPGALILILPLFWGCSRRAPQSPAEARVLSREGPAAEQAETVPFTDSAGRTVTVPAKITRVVPSGSLAQTFLLSIAPDLLCAVSGSYSAEEAEFIPPAVLGLPVVGQFYGTADLNYEEIAAIGPEIVIDIGAPKKSIVQDMDAITQAISIPAVHITAALDSTPDAFRTLGKLLGREERGEALAAFCEKTLAAAAEIRAGAGNRKKQVIYCTGKTGLNVIAAGSFHAEVLDFMSENRAVVDSPSSRGSGNETDLEQLYLWDPELIIFAPDSIYDTVGGDPTWRQIRAIHNGAYYEVPIGPYNWLGSPPSINRYLGILWLGTLLYPEYARYDLFTETAEYYRLFYGYELSRERYEGLTAKSLTAGGSSR